MQLYLNNELIETRFNILDKIIAQHLPLAADQRIAIAVNGAVITKSQWSTVTLSANDKIETFSAVAGG